MKYRVVHGFPNGYNVQSSIFGLRWKLAIHNIETRKPYKYETIEDAKRGIRALKLYGTEVKNA